MTKLRDRLAALALKEAEEVASKDASYGSSWKKRGGVGAFMMLARKWDRLENQTARAGYDIFAAVLDDGGVTKRDGIIDDIRDLRRYLLLVEDELTQREASGTDSVVVTSRTVDGVETGLVVKRRLAGQPRGFDPEQDVAPIVLRDDLNGLTYSDLRRKLSAVRLEQPANAPRHRVPTDRGHYGFNDRLLAWGWFKDGEFTVDVYAVEE